MSLETAPTEYIEAAGVRFAYRRLGPREGTPLVFLQHFTGTIESWDPAAVNGLAENRPVIVFDYTGVGTSSGKTPDNVAQMAADAERFIAALGCVQVRPCAKNDPGRHRPQGGEEHLLKVVEEAFSHQEAPDVRLPLFFTSSEASQAAGRAFLKRASVRTVERDPESGQAVNDPQAKALIDWGAFKDPEHSLLKVQ